MKIRAVGYNNRKKLFEVRVGASMLAFPYSKAEPMPTANATTASSATPGAVFQEAQAWEKADSTSP